MARREAFGEACELLHVRPQLLRAERAVQADRERSCMAHRVVERFGGLSGKRAPGGVGDGAGDDDRQSRAAALECIVDGEERGFRIEGVEYCFGETPVEAAIV